MDMHHTSANIGELVSTLLGRLVRSQRWKAFFFQGSIWWCSYIRNLARGPSEDFSNPYTVFRYRLLLTEWVGAISLPPGSYKYASPVDLNLLIILINSTLIAFQTHNTSLSTILTSNQDVLQTITHRPRRLGSPSNCNCSPLGNYACCDRDHKAWI